MIRLNLTAAPEWLELAPDLRLQGSDPLRLTGRLRIPRAAIEVKELPSGTVTVSADEIVVGEARVTDWNWAPDLAVTQDGVCPPAPPSNLPPAQVFP